MPIDELTQHLQTLLDRKIAANHYRTLRHNDPNMVDFCSNDYIGMARNTHLHQAVLTKLMQQHGAGLGSTGSRLLRGNNPLAEQLEQQIADFHGAEAALLFNSGYDANVGLFQAIARRGDWLLFDEFSHASTRDGIRLSHAQAHSFTHNHLEHLEQLLQRIRQQTQQQSSSGGRIFVSVESIYSMDGDQAPLAAMVQLCQQYGAYLIVDEAHATAVAGKQGEGVVAALQLEQYVFARIHTFGKAMGVHGAAIVGSAVLRHFLINYCRSFIYTTALPLHSLIALQQAYHLLQQANMQAALHQLQQNIQLFCQLTQRHAPHQAPPAEGTYMMPSVSPIQAWVIPNNERVRRAANQLQAAGYDVRAILSPTVPTGMERCRICIHSFNTTDQIHGLVRHMQAFDN